MESFSWMAALALSLAAPAPAAMHCKDGSSVTAAEGCTLHGGEAVPTARPSPARDALPPTQRAEDRPAHESPYSAFGAPHARRTQPRRRNGARLHCADGTVQTQGQKGDVNACDSHGGVKR